jgi:hypothetical protein
LVPRTRSAPSRRDHSRLSPDHVNWPNGQSCRRPEREVGITTCSPAVRSYSSGFRGRAVAISQGPARCETRRKTLLPFRRTRRRWHMEIVAPRPADTPHERERERGLPANALHRHIDRAQKLLAKPRSATLLPNIGFGNIEFGFWRNNQFSGHTGRALFVSHLPRTIPTSGF